MRLVIDEQNRIAEVWMSHADQADERNDEVLKNIIDEYSAKKFTVCVYRSGKGSVLENTKALLVNNYYSNCERV